MPKVVTKERISEMPKSDTTGKVEAIVYLVISPTEEPGYRLYGRGVHAVERALETQSYWFVRLGQIHGWRDWQGVTFSVSTFADLPQPSESAWQIGRLNPAFGRSEVSKYAFEAAFRAVERMLDSWKRNEDGIVEAYTLKELIISPQQLESLTTELYNSGKVHEVPQITVIKYWYDDLEQGRHLPWDLALAEYFLRIPLQFRWAAGENLLSVEVMPFAPC